ncbi:hypothetical protein B566_EDAN003874 [Ephemera danica]|nr:hypothetical protein B566_EDAN003874 [Ephemera danica]
MLLLTLFATLFFETPEREKGEVASMPANEKLLNTIFRGEVASVVNFGAFVSIPGTKNQGLIHKSQISNAPVDDANDVLQRGESVWCKADGKIGLSMKVVNQGSGQDLDPNGVQIQQDEKKRQAYNPRQGNRKIQLEAVCEVCGRQVGALGPLDSGLAFAQERNGLGMLEELEVAGTKGFGKVFTGAHGSEL